MAETILALEGFGGGESIGCVAATLALTPERIDQLLALADAYRAAPKLIIRMVFADFSPIRWFVEFDTDHDDTPAAIADFTQETSGFKVIDKHPGDPNLPTDVRTVHLTAGSGDEVEFTWRAVTREDDEAVETASVPESFLRQLRATP